jgi:phosphorylcholine metabolism protein LicD
MNTLFLEYMVAVVVVIGAVVLVAIGRVPWDQALSLITLTLGYAFGSMKTNLVLAQQAKNP